MPKKFEVVFTNSPQSAYYPGAVLEGKVLLELDDELKMRDIYACCEGYGHVRWSEGSDKNRRTYSAKENYMKTKVGLLSKSTSDDVVLKNGHYEYPFAFQLPTTLPTSYESSIGRVRYYIKITIDRPWRFDHHTKKLFTILSHLDLNKQPGSLMGPGENTSSKVLCCWCCASDPITATMRVERLGFVAGESIKFSAEINNQSTREMTCTKAKLIQRVTYHATSKSRTWSHTMAKLRRGAIKGGGRDEWRGERLVIPPVPPSYLQGCNIIDIHYYATMIVDPSGVGFDLNVPVEVVIGTVPLAGVVEQYGVQRQSQSEGLSPAVLPIPGAPGSLYTDSSAPKNPFAPTLAESAMGRVNTRDDDDQHTQGEADYAPMYTYFTWEKQEPASLFTASGNK